MVGKKNAKLYSLITPILEGITPGDSHFQERHSIDILFFIFLGKVNPLKHGVIFQKSTHWIQKSHPDVVANIVLDFLKATQERK